MNLAQPFELSLDVITEEENRVEEAEWINLVTNKIHTDSSIITAEDEQKIQYDPSFTFTPQIYKKMSPKDKEWLQTDFLE
jgi:hypothetical protein